MVNLNIINIYKHIKSIRKKIINKINFIWIYTQNILVWVGFSFGSLDTKILNSFRYLTNFGLSVLLIFRIEFGSVLWIWLFVEPYSDLCVLIRREIETDSKTTTIWNQTKIQKLKIQFEREPKQNIYT